MAEAYQGAQMALSLTEKEVRAQLANQSLRNSRTHTPLLRRYWCIAKYKNSFQPISITSPSWLMTEVAFIQRFIKFEARPHRQKTLFQN